MEHKEKMAVIAGASKALEMKARGKSDDEILREITERTEDILSRIDGE